MLLLARLVALIIMGMGITFVVKPKTIKKTMAYIEEGKRLYGVAVARLAFAAIFLLAASQSKSSGIVAIFGILCLIGGVAIFALGQKKCKNIMKKWLDKPTKTLRLLSIIPIAVGLFLLYSI